MTGTGQETTETPQSVTETTGSKATDGPEATAEDTVRNETVSPRSADEALQQKAKSADESVSSNDSSPSASQDVCSQVAEVESEDPTKADRLVTDGAETGANVDGIPVEDDPRPVAGDADRSERSPDSEETEADRAQRARNDVSHSDSVDEAKSEANAKSSVKEPLVQVSIPRDDAPQSEEATTVDKVEENETAATDGATVEHTDEQVKTEAPAAAADDTSRCVERSADDESVAEKSSEAMVAPSREQPSNDEEQSSSRQIAEETVNQCTDGVQRNDGTQLEQKQEQEPTTAPVSEEPEHTSGENVKSAEDEASQTTADGELQSSSQETCSNSRVAAERSQGDVTGAPVTDLERADESREISTTASDRAASLLPVSSAEDGISQSDTAVEKIR